MAAILSLLAEAVNLSNIAGTVFTFGKNWDRGLNCWYSANKYLYTWWDDNICCPLPAMYLFQLLVTEWRPTVNPSSSQTFSYTMLLWRICFSVVQLRETWNLPLSIVSHLMFSFPASLQLRSLNNSEQRTCDNHKGNSISPLWQLFGIAGHKLAFSPVCLHPPLSLSLFSLGYPLRSSTTCTRPLKETSFEQSILTAQPHTMLPAPLIICHHPSAPLYSQRKSPFPEAITLIAAKSNTYGWAVWGASFLCM